MFSINGNNGQFDWKINAFRRQCKVLAIFYITLIFNQKKNF